MGLLLILFTKGWRVSWEAGSVLMLLSRPESDPTSPPCPRWEPMIRIPLFILIRIRSHILPSFYWYVVGYKKNWYRIYNCSYLSFLFYKIWYPSCLKISTCMYAQSFLMLNRPARYGSDPAPDPYLRTKFRIWIWFRRIYTNPRIRNCKMYKKSLKM